MEFEIDVAARDAEFVLRVKEADGTLTDVRLVPPSLVDMDRISAKQPKDGSVAIGKWTTEFLASAAKRHNPQCNQNYFATRLTAQHMPVVDQLIKALMGTEDEAEPEGEDREPIEAEIVDDGLLPNE